MFPNYFSLSGVSKYFYKNMQKKQKLFDEQNQTKRTLESLLPEDRFFDTNFNKSMTDEIESMKLEDLAQGSLERELSINEAIIKVKENVKKGRLPTLSVPHPEK